MAALSNARHERFAQELAKGKSATEARYYVYTLSCPESGKPFYVGKGSGRRRFHHEREARNSNSAPSKKIDFIRALHDRGLRPVVAVVIDRLTETAALIHERKMIREIGYANLTNILPGSENSTTKAYRESKDMLARLKTAEMVRAEGDWWNGAKLDFRLRHRDLIEQQLIEMCAMLEAKIKGSDISHATSHS